VSDKELVRIEPEQLAQLIAVLTAQNNALWAINDQLKPLDNGLDSLTEAVDAQTKDVTKWLGVVAEAINNLTLPQPQPTLRGTIMSDYQIPADQADARVTFNLVGITDSEGNPITDPEQLAKLLFEATSSDPSVFEVTLDADQPDGAKRVGGYHVGAPGQAAVTSNLKQADGDLIATGTDGFTVTTGEATLGSVNAEFEGLTPIS